MMRVLKRLLMWLLKRALRGVTLKPRECKVCGAIYWGSFGMEFCSESCEAASKIEV